MESKIIEEYAKEKYQTWYAQVFKERKTNINDVYMVQILVEEPKAHYQFVYVSKREVEEWQHGKK